MGQYHNDRKIPFWKAQSSSVNSLYSICLLAGPSCHFRRTRETQHLCTFIVVGQGILGVRQQKHNKETKD